MRKSKAKEKIIKSANDLIETKGYASLNINEVAYVAKVSVGTLYYHFPKGKVDILAEIMSRKLEGYVETFNQQDMMKEISSSGLSLDEMLQLIFKKVIEFRRPDREFLAAIQNEMFSNPEEYYELLEQYDLTEGVKQGMGILFDIILKESGNDKKDPKKLKEKQERIFRVVGLLMSYQIIFPKYFGKDDDFVKMAVDVFLHIVNS